MLRLRCYLHTRGSADSADPLSSVYGAGARPTRSPDPTWARRADPHHQASEMPWRDRRHHDGGWHTTPKQCWALFRRSIADHDPASHWGDWHWHRQSPAADRRRSGLSLWFRGTLRPRKEHTYIARLALRIVYYPDRQLKPGRTHRLFPVLVNRLGAPRQGGKPFRIGIL